MKTILIVLGTRPETIKLAPLILLAKKQNLFRVLVCSTGQHREMISPLFKFFGITPDFDLDLMTPGQTLADISVNVLKGLNSIFESHPIHGVVVQGDTTTCFAASLAAFYKKIPVAHVEAGLRSGDIHSPFPEEFNRMATGLIAKLHFAPTQGARENLIREHYSENNIFVTGNTGIDALFEAKLKIESDAGLLASYDQTYSFLNRSRKLILVTIHRRESFGRPLEEVFAGLKELSFRNDIEILIPLHLNPEVRKTANRFLGNDVRWIGKSSSPEAATNTIWLSEPIDYVPFIYLMNRAHFIITDSGGIQEEAPSLGKPVLVAREKTERPEGIAAGTSKLVPLTKAGFLKITSELLDHETIYGRMARASNPFGDGNACARIIQLLEERL